MNAKRTKLTLIVVEGGASKEKNRPKVYTRNKQNRRWLGGEQPGRGRQRGKGLLSGSKNQNREMRTFIVRTVGQYPIKFSNSVHSAELLRKFNCTFGSAQKCKCVQTRATATLTVPNECSAANETKIESKSDCRADRCTAFYTQTTSRCYTHRT